MSAATRREKTEMIPRITTGRRAPFWIAMIVFLLSGGCGVRDSIYLDPGRYHGTPLSEGAGSRIVFQPFQIGFGEGQLIGRQIRGGHEIDLMTDPFTVTQTLDTSVQNRLAAKRVQLGGGRGWDFSVAGLGTLPSGTEIVLGGKVTRLWMTAETGPMLTGTDYVLKMDVECFIGDIGQRRVDRRTVHLEEKRFEVSHSQKTMEKLLSDLVTEAAEQVFQSYVEVLGLKGP